MIVYIGVAMDKNGNAVRQSVEVAASLRDSEAFSAVPLEIFCPALAHFNNFPGRRVHGKVVAEMNRHALHQADVLVVIYHPGQETWGLPMEVRDVANTGRDIVVLNTEDVSADLLPMYLVALDGIVVVSNVEDLATVLRSLWDEAEQRRIGHTMVMRANEAPDD